MYEETNKSLLPGVGHYNPKYKITEASMPYVNIPSSANFKRA